MSARDVPLPEELETVLQHVCSERAVAARRHDEIRLLVSQPESSWPSCCRGDCDPCVADQISLAREILARFRARG